MNKTMLLVLLAFIGCAQAEIAPLKETQESTPVNQPTKQEQIKKYGPYAAGIIGAFYAIKARFGGKNSSQVKPAPELSEKEAQALPIDRELAPEQFLEEQESDASDIVKSDVTHPSSPAEYLKEAYDENDIVESTDSLSDDAHAPMDKQLNVDLMKETENLQPFEVETFSSESREKAEYKLTPKAPAQPASIPNVEKSPNDAVIGKTLFDMFESAVKSDTLTIQSAQNIINAAPPAFNKYINNIHQLIIDHAAQVKAQATITDGQVESTACALLVLRMHGERGHKGKKLIEVQKSLTNFTDRFRSKVKYAHTLLTPDHTLTFQFTDIRDQNKIITATNAPN
jgi:hypothetical protein